MNRAAQLAWYWSPVAIMLALIVWESTDRFSAQHTGAWLATILKWLTGQVPRQMALVNMLVRKAGHVTGYGLLSALLFRAFRGTFRARIANGVLGADWRAQWAVIAAFITFLVATADEMHQKMIPSRTGSWWDVFLDTAAAVLVQLFILLWFQMKSRRATPEHSVVEF